MVDADGPMIREHNARRQSDFQFQLDLLPEPFLGPIDAPLVLLNLNPGYSEQDIVDYSSSDRRHMMRASLTHDLSRSEAFYFLHEQFEDTGGSHWWRKRLAPLIRRVGLDAVRDQTQVIEFVPYKSRKFWDTPAWLPSQTYNFELARKALSRGAILVVMRKFDSWVTAVPELETDGVHRLKNWQNVTLGPGNCPTGFDAIIERLSR